MCPGTGSDRSRIAVAVIIGIITLKSSFDGKEYEIQVLEVQFPAIPSVQ